MRLPLIVAVVALAALVATAPDDAGACSCAAVDPEERLKQVDAAVIGTVVSDDDRSARIRVEHDFKVDLGEEIVVPTSGDDSSCALELEPGQHVGLFLTRDDRGRWRSGLCDTVDPDDLPGAAERMPAPLGEGTAVLLANGSSARGRVAALDAEGRPVAYGAGTGVAHGVSVCPGSHHAAEIVSRGARDWIAVRRLRDMAVVRERRSPWRRNLSRLACRDPEGRRIFAVAGASHQGGPVVALEGGRPRTVHRGRHSHTEFAGGYAILSGRRGASLLDLDTGAIRRLRGVRGSSESWTLSPDGTHLAGIAPGFDDRDLEGAVMVVDLERRTPALVRRSRDPFALTNAVLWLDDDRLLVAGESRRLLLVDRSLRTLRSFASDLEPAGLVLAEGRLYGIADELHVAEAPDFVPRALGRLPATGLSSLQAIPGGAFVDVTP